MYCDDVGHSKWVTVALDLLSLPFYFAGSLLAMLRPYRWTTGRLFNGVWQRWYIRDPVNDVNWQFAKQPYAETGFVPGPLELAPPEVVEDYRTARTRAGGQDAAGTGTG